MQVRAGGLRTTPPKFRMLQLKPQERQGEGRRWVLLQTHSAGMGEEPEDLGSRSLPSSCSSGRVQVGSASITHIQHSMVLLSTAASHQPAGMAPALRFLVPRGPTQGTSPHPSVPAREFFAVSGHRHGARAEGVSASRWDRGEAGACQPSFRPHPSPPSSFTSCLGPSEILSLQL